MRLLLLGDLILDEPDPDSFFEPSRELLRSADLVVGQVEVPHTARGVPSSVDIPAPPADPARLAALGRAGLGIATLAGNHIFDSGPNGIEDTLAALHELGIETAGAGMNIEEARRPADRRAASACCRTTASARGRAAPPRARRAPPPSTCSPTTSSTTPGPAGRRASTRSSTPESLDLLRADVLALRADGRGGRRRLPQGHRARPGRRARLRARARPDGDRLRRRHRRRPPRAHPPRDRDLSRQARLPRPRQLRRRHARADAVGRERRRARPPGRGDAASSSASSPTRRCLSTRSTRRAATR